MLYTPELKPSQKIHTADGPAVEILDCVGDLANHPVRWNMARTFDKAGRRNDRGEAVKIICGPRQGAFQHEAALNMMLEGLGKLSLSNH